MWPLGRGEHPVRDDSAETRPPGRAQPRTPLSPGGREVGHVGESPRGLLTNTEQGLPVSTDQRSTDGSGALTTTSRIVEIMPAAQHGLVSGQLGSFFHESAEPCSIRMRRQGKGGKGDGGRSGGCTATSRNKIDGDLPQHRWTMRVQQASEPQQIAQPHDTQARRCSLPGAKMLIEAGDR